MIDGYADSAAEAAAERYRRQVDDEGVLSVEAGELLVSFGHAEGTVRAREAVADLLWEVGVRTEPPLATARLDARSKLKLRLVDDDQASAAAQGVSSQMAFEQAGNERGFQQLRWRIGIAAVVLLLFVGWRGGTFDDVLVHVGLNAKPCLRNAYGATFCGSSAKSYCESLPAEGYGVRMCQEAGDAPLVPPASAASNGEEPSITTPSTEP
jgi:hypothetical protein